ncbi:MAG: hypothetical protein IJ187_07110 [Neisseriaceae bacterium]|nr:hypothetical protein [Neisseriaceae bacterium]
MGLTIISGSLKSQSISSTDKSYANNGLFCIRFIFYNSGSLKLLLKGKNNAIHKTWSF